VVGNLALILLEIYCSLHQWKNFTNPPRIDKVIAMVREDPAPPPKGEEAPIFGSCLLWPSGRPSQLLLSSCSVSAQRHVEPSKMKVGVVHERGHEPKSRTV